MTLTKKARELRKNQTDVERLLWGQLRNRRFFNCKFRRQFVIAPYIVDFVCVERKLIIELDGSQHLIQTDDDRKRSEYLRRNGFKVMHFWNNEVIDNFEGVLEQIRRMIESSNEVAR